MSAKYVLSVFVVRDNERIFEVLTTKSERDIGNWNCRYFHQVYRSFTSTRCRLTKAHLWHVSFHLTDDIEPLERVRATFCNAPCHSSPSKWKQSTIERYPRMKFSHARTDFYVEINCTCDIYSVDFSFSKDTCWKQTQMSEKEEAERTNKQNSTRRTNESRHRIERSMLGNQ